MANRVTTAEVQKIMDIDDEITDIEPFIIAANLIVTEKLSDKITNTAILKEVERWLAAHFIAARDPIVSKETIGDTKAEYYGKTDLSGIQSTPYGERAVLMDVSGTLKNLGKKNAEIKVII